MSRLIKIYLILVLFPFSANASVNVVVSVKPLQMIVHEVTSGVTEPELLVASNASPHDYALKPSDVKKINRADLVVWFGPELESFLKGVLSGKEQALQLGADSRLDLHEFGEHHEHDGHKHHGTHDPHVWLGPDQADQIAKIVAEKLAQSDEKNADKYLSNYQQFSSRLAEESVQIASKIKPVLHEGYYVFHDAYGYFERKFGLNKLGQFTVSPERKPGAKTLIRIKKALKSGNVKCVFSEPQFKPAVIETVTRGTGVSTGQLDPLAVDIEVSDGSYFRFLNSIADSYISCLSSK